MRIQRFLSNTKQVAAKCYAIGATYFIVLKQTHGML